MTYTSSDRAGSLSLRLGSNRPPWTANANGYSRCPPVLTDQWSDERQGYPKDYDFSNAVQKNAFRSSYNQLGYEKDWYLPNTTAKELQEQCLKATRKCTVPKISIPNEPLHTSLNRYAAALTKKYPPMCPQIPLHSTYRNDYKLPSPLRPPWLKTKPRWDEWNWCIQEGAFKKCKSSFLECDSYRHMGLHRWQDVCNFYPNQQFRNIIVKVRNPLVIDDDAMIPRY